MRKPAGTVRYAVVGLGYIAQIAVLPAFRHARRNSELVALVSGDARKLRKLGRTYGVDRLFSYENYGACLADVDAVYLALPNHQHCAYTLAAAEAGVHVLCEKPLAVDDDECARMIAAVERAGVRLMTAYRLHFERANLEAIRIARSRRLGDLRFFHSVFTNQVRAGDIRLGPEKLGGGAASDLGVYCLNAVRHLFDAEPEEVFAYTATSGEPRFAATHEMISALLRFPGERLASFTVSNGAADTGWFELVGTKGRLRLAPAFEFASGLKMELQVGKRTERRAYPKRDQFAPELLHFSDAVLRGGEPGPGGREGLADVRIVRALLDSAASGKPVRLPRFESASDPDLRLEIHRPPIDPPKLVRARKPSRG
jgi:predicted dehydrogenase